MIRKGAALSLLLLAACSSGETEKQAEAAPPPPCESATFEGAALTHCTATPGHHTIHMVLGSKAGEPYRSLSQLAVNRPDKSPPVAFAMNGGMFDADGQPIGYYVEDGERLHKLNRNEGPGNFHLLPNGVFYGDTDGHWAVRSSSDFAAKVTNRPDFGTQSGPMLVIDGKLHPRIDRDGTSLKQRNGVGVDARGRAHFVISDEPISFGKLARYFRDDLRCPNALYLDGSVSSLWDPEHGRVDGGPPLGPLIVVEKTAMGGETKANP
ncbi:phosphodiester glycosidase family protein [Novosphingobium mangrovi (ex Huang et al. 2023)]|uniref:Phosphodiester glycosidase family protein n=1 Tax=Novosphingobium mangrovi (ex Huang et al. 2023) TaxID=2976432 RepID=A0ABT2I3Y9_9SPHN|nr:phosphodiester glycosidase family protein [Novosphingobium mangrovi (ex Huang et al. 2023)]MCT2399525.1 phosphodiester glycosidase family protein [Novosphingobium mangrovi (ex Huang et al. 2023)]